MLSLNILAFIKLHPTLCHVLVLQNFANPLLVYRKIIHHDIRRGYCLVLWFMWLLPNSIILRPGINVVTLLPTYSYLYCITEHYLMGLGLNPPKKIPQNTGKRILISEGMQFNSLLSIKSQNYRILILNRSYFTQFQINLSETLHEGEVFWYLS